MGSRSYFLNRKNQFDCPIVHVSQDDSNVSVRFYLSDLEELNDENNYIFLIRAYRIDGYVAEVYASLIRNEGHAILQFVVDSSITYTEGNVPCEIIYQDLENGIRMRYAKFILAVERTPLEDDRRPWAKFEHLVDRTAYGKFTEDGIVRVEPYAFSNCVDLRAVQLNNCQYIASGAFSNCFELRELYLPVCSYIGHGFSGCSKLAKITLLSNSIVQLGAYYMFDGTAIKRSGFIYVPESLVSGYKSSDPRWSYYASRIFPVGSEG